MQNREYVYFLSVDCAKAIAAQHADDENWDLWDDEGAQTAGCVANNRSAS